MQQEVARVAFAEALQSFWQILVGLGAFGLIASFFMKGLKLHTAMDEVFSLQDESLGPDRGKYTTVDAQDDWIAFDSRRY